MDKTHTDSTLLVRWLLLTKVKHQAQNLYHYLEATWFNPYSHILCVTALVLGLQGERALVVVLSVRILFCIWEKKENNQT